MNQNTNYSPESTIHPSGWHALQHPLATAIVIVLLGSILMMRPVEAAIYKCLESDGGISYSSTACVDSNQTARVLADNGINDIGSNDHINSEQKSTRTYFTDQKFSETDNAEGNHRAEKLKSGPMY